MKKLYIYLVFFLLLSVNINSQQITIYDYMKLVERNPRLYVIVPGTDVTPAELNSVSVLSTSLDVRKIYKENEIGSLSNNLIIIGSTKTNKKIKYLRTDALISIYGTNLIISGSSSEIKKAIGILGDYEANRGILSVAEFEQSPKEFFSQLKSFFSLTNIVYTVVAMVLVVSVVGVMLRRIRKPSTRYPQLLSFAQKALQKGYTKDQIAQSLIKAGWQKNVLDDVFKGFP